MGAIGIGGGMGEAIHNYVSGGTNIFRGPANAISNVLNDIELDDTHIQAAKRTAQGLAGQALLCAGSEIAEFMGAAALSSNLNHVVSPVSGTLHGGYCAVKRYQANDDTWAVGAEVASTAANFYGLVNSRGLYMSMVLKVVLLGHDVTNMIKWRQPPEPSP
jgi:hypothetical protein